MRCDADITPTITLHLDVPTFQLMLTAISFYVERGSLPPGSSARELMWKFSGILSGINKPKTEEPTPAAIPAPATPVALLSPPPSPVGNPTPPLAETITMGTVEAPEEDWDLGEEVE
jgi:hypothetical protein